MNAKYDAACKLLSETGKSKTASELPEHGFLREERAKAVKKCWFFEDWHEMRRDRKSTAPARVRVGGGEGSVRVGRDGTREEASGDFSEDNNSGEGGEDDGQDTERRQDSPVDPNEDDGRPTKKAKTAKQNSARTSRTSSSSAAAGTSKRSHGASSAVDALASTMRDNMKEREERALARDRMEQERVDIARMEAETRRIEAETAREAQRQQSELINKMITKLL
ncbi:hypothetical protein OC834_007691 [Tilletia horrida]|nr:hypothetical protein OC834_007691 [Tilletia horrida]